MTTCVSSLLLPTICFLYQNKSLSKTLKLDSSYKPNFNILHSPYAFPTPGIPEPRA